MTAEIVLLNSYAVAMAADSAIMAADKIYQSANKIFALSDSHPVGVMFYQDVSFMGVPWETVIKMVRRTIPASGFPTVDDYATHFREFLLSESGINNPASREQHVYRVLRGCFQSISKKAEKGLSQGGHAAGTNAARKTIKALLKDEEDHLASDHGAITPGSARYKRVKDTHEQLVVAAANLYLREAYGRDLPKSVHARLIRIATAHLYFASTLPGPLAGSGLVFAGFGERQVFPQVIHLEIEGIPFGDTLVYAEVSNVVAQSGHADLMPFAQDDAAMAFITGIDPGLDLQYTATIRKTAESVVDEIIAILQATNPSGGAAVWAPLQSILKTRAEAIARQLSIELGQWISENRVSPMRNVVRHLQKDELAETAEAIINLTKLTRRLSRFEESVGGPIDVAIISKGDGFVWTRRKHYFLPDENFGFFATRLGKVLAGRQPVE